MMIMKPYQKISAFLAALLCAVPAASAELVPEGNAYHELGNAIETTTQSGMAIIAVIIIILAAGVVLSALKRLNN